MEFITRFFNFLRRLLKLEQDIEAIMKPITKITTKLEQHSKAQLAAAEADEAAARQAIARAAEEREIAAEAMRLKEKFAA